jgi:lysozyme
MKTSDEGVRFITKHEGLVLRAYKDVVGVWTIGVGHTARAGGIKPKAGMKITRDQAMKILRQDLQKFEARVNKVGVFVSQHAFDGAVSFDFNTGRIHNATWVKLYGREEMERASKSLMQWVKAGGKTVKGLINRRKAEQHLIFWGRYGPVSDIHGSVTAPEGVGRDVPTTGKPSSVDKVVKEVQEILAKRGFDPGKIDGWWGPKTKAAVLAYQKTHPHLENDGILGPATISQLRRDADLAKSVVSETFTKKGFGTIVSTVGAIAGGIPWYVIAGVVAALVIGFVVWKYGDVLMARFNKLTGKEVQ